LAKSAATVAPPPDEATSDGRSSPQRGPHTRDAIHAAAIDLFAQRGYHATSMRAIAAEARIRPAAIYHWYENKEAILVQLQDEFMAELTERVTAAMDRHERPALRLAAAVREHVVYHGLHTKAGFVTDSEIRALTEARRQALVAKRDTYEAIFRDEILGGIADGTLRSSNADVATYAILLQCTGVDLWFNPGGPLPLDEVADIHIELVLGSLGASQDLVAEAIERTGNR
jgi:AcrR family transcriptional regulator